MRSLQNATAMEDNCKETLRHAWSRMALWRSSSLRSLAILIHVILHHTSQGPATRFRWKIFFADRPTKSTTRWWRSKQNTISTNNLPSLMIDRIIAQVESNWVVFDLIVPKQIDFGFSIPAMHCYSRGLTNYGSRKYWVMRNPVHEWRCCLFIFVMGE